MSTAATPRASPRRDPVVSRLRAATRAAVLGALAIALCVVAVAMGSRHNARFDVTATRQHGLSARTLRTLETLDAPVDLIVCADLSAMPRTSRQRLTDLLDELVKASGFIGASVIDISSSAGASQRDSALRSLAEPHAELHARQAQTLEVVAQTCTALAADVSTLGDGLRTVRDALGPATPQGKEADDGAAVLKNLSADFTRIAEQVRAAAESQIAGVNLPEVDRAQEAASALLKSFSTEAPQLEGFADRCDAAMPADAPAEAKQATSVMRQAARPLGDRAGAAYTQLMDLSPGDTLLIARLLRDREGVIVASHRGARAVSLDSIFPARNAPDPAVAGLFAGEAVLSRAVAALSGREAPVVVFVHGEQSTLLEAPNTPSTTGRGVMGKLLERLRLESIDTAEWPTALRQDRPDLSPLDPDGDRRVVWVVFGPPFGGQGDNAMLDRANRLGMLAEAAADLLNTGERVMLCLGPSEITTRGERDPLATLATSVGVLASTNLLLVRTEPSPGGVVFTHTAPVLREADAANPIGAAINGIATVMPGAVPLEPARDAAGRTLTPILTVTPGGAEARTWAESSWLSIPYPLPDQPFDLRTKTPAADPSRDNTQGPWPVVIASERAAEPSGAAAPPDPSRGRAVVVGSGLWFMDPYAARTAPAENRLVELTPGNADLFEGCVLWLAGMEDRIVVGARAGDVPRIRAMTPGELSLVRWGLIAGLPLLVLLIGGVLRIWRG